MIKVGDKYKDGKVISIAGTTVTYMIPIEGEPPTRGTLETVYMNRKDQEAYIAP